MRKVFIQSACAVALSLILAGCGEKSLEEHLQQAEQFIQLQDNKSAVIELKSAIQLAPDNAQARVLLGRLYLAVGEGVAADKELTRALKNGTAIADIAVDLARAAYLSGVAPSVALEGVGLPSATQELITFYRLLTRFDNAEMDNLPLELAEFAQQASDVHLQQAALGLQAVMNQNYDSAIDHLQKIATTSPIYWDTQLLQAKVFISQNKFEQAIATLQAYVGKMSAANAAKLMLAETFVRSNKTADAAPILNELLRIYPEQPLANYLQAVIFYDNKNFVGAKERAEKALDNGLTVSSVRILAALASIQQNLNAQALAHLRLIKDDLKNYPSVEKAYAYLELKDGNITDATTIISGSPTSTEDLAILTSASFELIKRGATAQAAQVVSHLENSVEKSVDSLTNLSMLKMGLGDVAEGTRLLEEAVKLDPTIDKNQLALALTYIHNNQTDQAQAIADGFVKNANTEVLGQVIHSYVALAKGNHAEVEKAADRILTLQPNHVLALLMKARVAAVKGDLTQINQLLERVFTIEPGNYNALEMDFEFNKTEPQATKARDRISAALTREPQNIQLLSLQARVLFSQQKIDDVISLLTESTIDPQSRPNLYWQLLIASYKLKKQFPESLKTSTEWATLQPQNLAAQITHIGILTENRRFKDALSLTQQQLKLYPTMPELKRIAAYLQAETQDYSAAVTSLNALPKAVQASAEMLMLRGKLLATQGKFTEAKAVLLDGYQQAKSVDSAMYIAGFLAERFSAEQAVRFLENHFSTEPKSALLQAMYANLLLNIDPNKASTTFNTLITEDPENFMALNNLAYLNAELGKAEEAEPYVVRALKLEPNNPDALDTMGRVMLLKGNTKDALSYLERSLKIRPDHPDVLLNYAEALIVNGETEKARGILASIEVKDPILMKKQQRIQGKI